MTITQTRHAIGDLGLTFGVTILGTYCREFRVNYHRSDRRWLGDDSAYYTNDLQDAYHTAISMSKYTKD